MPMLNTRKSGLKDSIINFLKSTQKKDLTTYEVAKAINKDHTSVIRSIKVLEREKKLKIKDKIKKTIIRTIEII